MKVSLMNRRRNGGFLSVEKERWRFPSYREGGMEVSLVLRRRDGGYLSIEKERWRFP